MSTETLDEPVSSTEQAPDELRLAEAVDRVQLSYKCVKLHVTSIPRKRSATDAKRKQVAAMHNADEEWLTFMSRLWDPDQPAMQRFNKAEAAVKAVFTNRLYTLPSVWPGVRMIRRSRLLEFQQALELAAEDYREAVEALAAEMPLLVEKARESRGDLFNPDDYAFDPRVVCSINWSYPVIAEDTELAEISPDIYQREVARVREELRGVVLRCEQEMSQRLLEAVQHMAERLTVSEDGKQKVFQMGTVSKLLDEMDYIAAQFETNRIGNQPLLDAVDGLKKIFEQQDRDELTGLLRGSIQYRESVQAACQQIAEQLEATAAPRRRTLLIPAHLRTAAAAE